MRACPQTAAEKEHREGGRCVRELLSKYKAQQEAVGTPKDFKPVKDEATGEQKESVRRRLCCFWTFPMGCACFEKR